MCQRDCAWLLIWNKCFLWYCFYIFCSYHSLLFLLSFPVCHHSAEARCNFEGRQLLLGQAAVVLVPAMSVALTGRAPRLLMCIPPMLYSSIYFKVGLTEFISPIILSFTIYTKRRGVAPFSVCFRCTVSMLWIRMQRLSLFWRQVVSFWRLL